MNDNDCCIINILKVINVLQDQAEKVDDMPSTCDRPFLGFTSNSQAFVYNTRPITLYTSNNLPLTLPYTITYNGDEINSTSTAFRVEKVCDNCVTCRVLATNPDESSSFPYVKTDSFFTVSCNCICALRCLDDTFIECV